MSLPGRAADVADDIVQLSPDTYVIRRNERPIYSAGSVGKQRKRIVEDADEFAAQKGKRAVEIAFDEEEHLLNEYYGTMSWEYKFRLVDDPQRTATAAAAQSSAATPASAAAPAASAAPAATSTAAVAATAAQAAQSAPDAAQAGEPAGVVDDIYDQLIKLDDLRKKGILTDEEFETLKQRVLTAH
jgi:hypothetical protein